MVFKLDGDLNSSSFYGASLHQPSPVRGMEWKNVVGTEWKSQTGTQSWDWARRSQPRPGQASDRLPGCPRVSKSLEA